MTRAFFGEALQQIAHEGLRTAFIERAAAWLAERERAA